MKKIILLAVMFVMSMTAFCQIGKESGVIKEEKKLNRNEIGIDVANALTFLSKKDESYLVNYKRHITDTHALRTALTFDYGTGENDVKSIGVRMGYEYDFNLIRNHWLLYMGADIPFSYYKANFQTKKTYSIGVTPLIGVSYYFTKNLCLSSEIGFLFQETYSRDPKSFVAEDNSENFNSRIGSVGMVVISYNFNLKK